MLLVVYCERFSGETIRIIPARKPILTERKYYEKGI